MAKVLLDPLRERVRQIARVETPHYFIEHIFVELRHGDFLAFHSAISSRWL